jgi:Sulfotransferase domain
LVHLSKLLRSLINAGPEKTPSTPASSSTIFHITHPKAGSQWIYKILRDCTPERIVTPKPRIEHFLKDPIVAGKIYPAVYVSKYQFDRVQKPASCIHFVVLRDLRDIAVSAYFSLKISHPAIGKISEFRKVLAEREFEEGMLWILQNWMSEGAEIFASWIDTAEPWIRYEDLLERDQEILQQVLLEKCGVEIDREKLSRIVAAHRFEQFTGGRPRGTEDIASHGRKGIAGDWKNYFTPRLKDEFKRRYGKLLILAGYEATNDW